VKIITEIDGPDADGFVWMSTDHDGYKGQVNLGHYSEDPAASVLHALGVSGPTRRWRPALRLINCKGENDG
jgi:hypothetical protein